MKPMRVDSQIDTYDSSSTLTAKQPYDAYQQAIYNACSNVKAGDHITGCTGQNLCAEGPTRPVRMSPLSQSHLVQ
jgi:hypothetical protein